MDCVVRVGSRTTCSFESQNTDHGPKFHAELVADIATCTDTRARRQRVRKASSRFRGRAKPQPRRTPAPPARAQ